MQQKSAVRILTAQQLYVVEASPMSLSLPYRAHSLHMEIIDTAIFIFDYTVARGERLHNILLTNLIS